MKPTAACSDGVTRLFTANWVACVGVQQLPFNTSGLRA